MKQDDYSGLARAYTTAPALAVQNIGEQVEDVYALVEVCTDALKKCQGCETASTENVLARATRDLNKLAEEVKALYAHLDGGTDDE